MLSHIREKYDTRSCTSDNVCYLSSTDCRANKAYTARMWYADPHHTDAAHDATFHRLKQLLWN